MGNGVARRYGKQDLIRRAFMRFAPVLAAGSVNSGSDNRLGCHSLPSSRFTTQGEGLKDKLGFTGNKTSSVAHLCALHHSPRGRLIRSFTGRMIGALAVGSLAFIKNLKKYGKYLLLGLEKARGVML